MCSNRYNAYGWEFIPAGNMTYLLRTTMIQAPYGVLKMQGFMNGGLTVFSDMPKYDFRDEESGYVSYARDEQEAGRWAFEPHEKEGYYIQLKGFINPKKTSKFVNGYLATTYSTKTSLLEKDKRDG